MRSITQKFLSVCLFSSTLIVGCSSELTEQEYIEAAKSLNDNGDLVGSVIELKNALKINRESSEARYLLGKTYLALRNGASAEKELLRARELGVPDSDLVLLISKSLLLQLKFAPLLEKIQPTHSYSQQVRAQLHAARAEAHLGLGEIQEATAESNIALGLATGSAPVYTVAAKLKMNQGKLDEARQYLNEAFLADPNYADAWSRLAQLESQVGRHDAALEAYSKVLAINSYRLKDRLSMAATYIEIGALSEAETELAIVKKAISKSFYISYLEGLIAFYRKDFSAAQARFEHSLQLDSSFVPTNFYLGASHYQQGHFVQAESYLSKFDSISRTFLPVKKLLVATYIGSNQAGEASRVLDEILAINPVDKVALNLKAKIANEQGNSDETLAYLHKVVDLEPGSVSGHRNLALGYLLSGDHELALKSLREAEDIDAGGVSQMGGDQLKYISYMSVKDYGNALHVARKMAENDKSADAHTLMGGALLGLGEIEDAEKAFRRALEISPGDSNAMRNLASILVAKGDEGAVKSLYLDSIESNPSNIEAFMKLARIEYEGNNQERARDIWLQAIEANPDSLAPRLQLSRYYVDHSQPRQALKLLMEVEAKEELANIKANPEFLREYGLALLSSGEAKDALQKFKALVSSTRSANDYYLLALAHEKLGSVAGMREGLNKAISLDSEHLSARILSAQLDMLEGKTESAAVEIATLRAKHPENVELLELDGRIALMQDRVKEAVEIFDGLTLDSSKSYLITELASAYWRQDDSAKSIEVLAQWLERFPEAVSVHKALANYHLLLGQNDSAVTGYKRVLELSPEDITSLNNLALLMKDSNLKEAKAFAEKAHDLHPDNMNIKDTLGAVLLAAGDYRKALRVLEQAYSRAQENSSISYHYAMALNENGSQSKAIEVLEKLLSDNRDFPEKDKAEALLNSIRS